MAPAQRGLALSQDVGINGNGTLNITGGAAVFATMGYGCIGEWVGATGAVTVDGTGSTWADLTFLNIGLGGNGTLERHQRRGRQQQRCGLSRLQLGLNGQRDRKRRASSTWTNGPIDVGISGSGTLSVSGGGAVSSGSGSIAGSSGSTSVATVDGVGSTWSNNGSLVVGNSGSGTLSVTNGGAVSSIGGSIGASSGSTGVATVDGAGSTWTSGSDLYVGNSGSGTLNVTNGGAVSVAGTTYVGFGAGSAGAINFGANGGTLTTGSLAASPSQLTGTGTINARGLVSDVNLLFDSAASLKQTLTFNNSARPKHHGESRHGQRPEHQRRPRRRLARQRFVDDHRRDRGQLPNRLHRLRQRLDGHRNGRRSRLEVDQQFDPLRRATPAAERSPSPAAAT